MTEYKDVLAWLSDPATYGSDIPVEVIRTHSAYVFLTEKLAFKIKRAVKYDYLDFTSLETRHSVLERELALNAPVAPTIYDRVVAITREESGRLVLDGDGEPVEYALRMQRFPREAELTSIADVGGLTNELAERLGIAVAAYHETAARRSEDGAFLIREIIEELRRVFANMQATLGINRVTTYSEQTEAAFTQVAPFLSQRTRQGRVRRCHGDLHLKNLVMIDGEPVPFDALEFDERLGTCDVLYDFAFLVMDMLHRALACQTNVLMNSYLRKSEDYAGLTLLPLYLSIRAAIRAMVAVQTISGAESGELAQDARHYLGQALEYLVPSPPRLVAIGGVSGTGKTTVARQIAPIVGAAPGAVHLRSDLERKAMFGVKPLEQLPETAYLQEVSQVVYIRLLERAEKVLGAGHSVILDATFITEEERVAARGLAERLHVPFDGIWLTADPATLEYRVTVRTGDASDASVAVLRAQLERETGLLPWSKIDSSGDPEHVAAIIEASLFTV